MLGKAKWKQYTTSEIEPTGWLRRQLEIQAQGLSGHLDKIWPDIRDSRWIGGDQEGWERVPYWLDGFIPLAYLLNDADLKMRAQRYIDAILAGQKEDGWICPCEEDERRTYDMWALFLLCKVLALYGDCSGDPRAEEAIYRALKQYNLFMEGCTVFGWAAARWYECLIPLFWLYERRPEEWMIDLAHKLWAEGIDYGQLFKHWRFAQPFDRWSFLTHVVNQAMALKWQALTSRLDGSDASAYAKDAIRTLLRDHGMAIPHFTGDECLSGTSPLQGSELCSVTEAMYSYEILLSVSGDAEWADRLEALAYNALPATIAPDMWSHQYDQMTNQMQCTPLDKAHKPFRTNNGESHLFGLEPNFGCCTANFNQGWPKFALSTFMQAEDGIAVTAIAPARLRTKVQGIDVTITTVTKYPFEDGYTVEVETAQPVEFTLYLRVPQSAASATIDGQAAAAGFHAVRRRFEGKTSVPIALTQEIRLTERPGGMHCVWRGPLLYALPIAERWEKVEYTENNIERKYPYCDYHIYPESKWNYAFADDMFAFAQGEVSDIPFDTARPPVWLEGKMAEIDWPAEGGICTALPRSTNPLTEPVALRLIPYGCTTLRMTEMPLLKQQRFAQEYINQER